MNNCLQLATVSDVDTEPESVLSYRLPLAASRPISYEQTL
jgi:hypothetical protein